MIAALAVLSDKQSKITAYEAEVLNVLQTKVGAKDFKVGGFEASYSALSSTVAAGTDYEAKMFLSAKLDVTPTMKFRGNTVKVENGVGIIKFKASATNYDAEGNAKQNWEGSISVAKPTGDGDTTFKVKGEYIVATISMCRYLLSVRITNPAFLLKEPTSFPEKKKEPLFLFQVLKAQMQRLPFRSAAMDLLLVQKISLFVGFPALLL
jgi:hypothetical protein